MEEFEVRRGMLSMGNGAPKSTIYKTYEKQVQRRFDNSGST